MKQPKPSVLAINGGSSSIKFALYTMGDAPQRRLQGKVERIGLRGTTLPATFANGMFIGQHGSWNRRPHSGYKVIFVPFKNGKPSSDAPVDMLTGFLSPDGKAYGRPVGVALDKHGALLVADDVGNVVWRVSAER